MHTPLTGRQIIASVLAGVGLLLALAVLRSTGHPWIAVALLVVVLAHGMYSLGAIRQADKIRAAAAAASPARTLRRYDTLVLRHSPAEVWALIAPAEHAPALNADIARGFRVPHTPQGVGEQQAFVMRDGTTSIVEVVEHVPGRRAVTRVVSPPTPVPVRSVYALEPLPTGCLLTCGLEVDAPPGHQDWSPEQQAQISDMLRTLLQRVDWNLTAFRPPADRSS